MEFYFILTSLGLLLFAIAVIGMVWMIRSGQVDDLDTPALRMLADDPPPLTDHKPADDAHHSPSLEDRSRD